VSSYFVNIDTSPSNTLAHWRHCWCALQIHDTYLLTLRPCFVWNKVGSITVRY